MRIHGGIHHRVCGLRLGANETPQYAQLYILDSAAALRERMGHSLNAQCSEATMRLLDTTLRRINPFCEAYQQMSARMAQEDLEQANNGGEEVPAVRMFLCRRNPEREYTMPVPTADVFAVFAAADGVPPVDQYVRIYQNDGVLRDLSVLSPLRDPMVYPLLFPNGEPGTAQDTQHFSTFKNLFYCNFVFRMCFGNAAHTSCQSCDVTCA